MQALRTRREAASPEYWERGFPQINGRESARFGGGSRKKLGIKGRKEGELTRIGELGVIVSSTRPGAEMGKG